MSELKDLQNLVGTLERAETDQARIEILQKIGAKLINEYEICVGDLTIKPMLVEAYYYHKGIFEDTSVHGSRVSKAPTYSLARNRQSDHFGKLYVHYGCKDGIDIVLSQGKYCLSFLVKNALVDGKWMEQCAISEKLCEQCDQCDKCEKGTYCKYYCDLVLKSAESPQWEIVFCTRKGITNDFACKKLAALPIDKIRDKTCHFTPGQSCTEIVREYISEQLKKNVKMPEEELLELKALASGLIRWQTFEEK